MENPMLMGQQNHYCENVLISENNLYVQCNPHQNSKDILHQDRKVNLKVHIEAQKISSNQSNPEPKEQY
jgi:hypothetical protein